MDAQEVLRRAAAAGLELADEEAAAVAELLERVLTGAAALEDELDLDGVEPFTP